MTEIFKDFYKEVLKWEGGDKLHKVEGDSGGWTLYGIAYNKNKHLFESLQDFKSMTYERAAEIAYTKYYLPIKTELLPEECQLFYFDMAYNMGNHRAISIMQDCLGVEKDGKIGKITRSKMPELELDCLYKKRKQWYLYLKNRTSWASKFYKGWINRTEDIYNKSLKYKKENEKSKQSNDDNISSSSSSTRLDESQQISENTTTRPERENTKNRKRFVSPFVRWFVQAFSGGHSKSK